jgi:putative two-component system response regulator
MDTMKMDVLIVDEEPLSRMATSQALQTAGFGVAFADSGEEAWSRINNENFQLVVCDCRMQGMSGLELCRAIRTNNSRRYVYLVLLTTHDRPQDLLEGLDAGADDYITKPINPAELILRIKAGRRIICSESSNLTIFSLAKLSEARNSETGKHLDRMRNYCRLLAQSLRDAGEFLDTIDEEYIRLIYETSPLHDIGKVAIPDSILLKPAKLTTEEFEIMKTHTLHGARTLAAAIQEFPHAQFLRMAYEIALTHHERFDGRGYPYGASGRDIPLSGRIVALADVYDALRSQRVYKRPMNHSEARSIIWGERRAHFDPAIVDAFLRVEDDFQQVQREFHDHDEAFPAPADPEISQSVYHPAGGVFTGVPATSKWSNHWALQMTPEDSATL